MRWAHVCHGLLGLKRCTDHRLPAYHTPMARPTRFLPLLLNHFLHLDLRGKITIALLAAALVLGTMITLPSYMLFRHQLLQNTQELLEAHALLEQREIELRLSSIITQAESLAVNTVTANALVDARSRDTYLEPLLRSQRTTVSGADMTVVDARGRAVASTQPRSPSFGDHPSFQRLMQRGRAAYDIDQPGQPGATLLLAVPIRYPLAHRIEGAVMLRVPLEPLLSKEWDDSVWLSDEQGRLLAGERPPGDAYERANVLRLPAPLDSSNLRVVLSRDKTAALRALDVLLMVFLLIGVCVLALVGLFAHGGTRLIARPLGEVAAAAEEIAESGRPVARLPIGRNDEFGRLSAAFNTMVDRLRESYIDLENRVAERTREYEASRREAERAGNLLREAVQSIAVGFTIYDENDRLVMCNEAYLRIYAQSRDLLVPGASFEEIVRLGALRGQYSDATGDVEAWVTQRVAQHRLAQGVTLEQRLGDGRWLLIIDHRTPSGYIVGNRIDITELKTTAEALAQSEQRWELALRGANDGVWDWNLTTGEVFYSERSKTMLGHEPNEFINGTADWFSRIHPDDLEATLALYQQHFRGETEFYEAEYRLRCKDGSYKWVLSRGKALFDENGHPVRMAGSSTDITERRAAEARVRDRTEQLNAIFSMSPDGFVSFDTAYRVKYASPAFRRMTGLDEADVVGLDEEAFSQRLSGLCTDEAKFPGMASLRTLILNDGAAVPGEAGNKQRHLIEMQAGKRMLEVGVRLSDAETVPQILYFRDVTHEVEVDRMKGQFLSTAAHELRTPMASIYGFSELLLSQRLSEAKKRDCVNAIHRQSQLMISIVNELLDLARIDARRGTDFKFQRVDVCELLHEIVANFKPPDDRPGPVEPPNQSPRWIRADRTKLTQAVANVLSNAYKYSPGGGTVSIDILDASAPAGEPQRIGIQVVDYGIGMTTAQLARVSERFYRADSSGKIPGTGLGMSIVKEIVELHDGQMTLSSEPEVGTTVTLWIPAA